MAKVRFVLQFAASEIDGLAAWYLEQNQGEDEEAFKAGSSIAGGDHNRQNLEKIFRWKTGGRGISRLSQNTDGEIADGLRLAIDATTERSAIAVLCGLNGVEVPVASAILTATKPQRFTIIDFRALESLGVSERRTYYSIDYYLAYLRTCQELSNEYKTSLRTLDRALWQWSRKNSKRELR